MLHPIRLNPYVRKPRDVFKTCPECRSTKLFPMDIQVSCLSCGWDSFDAFEKAGGLDYWEGDRIKREAQRLGTSADDVLAAEDETRARSAPEEFQVAVLRPARRSDGARGRYEPGTTKTRHGAENPIGF